MLESRELETPEPAILQFVRSLQTDFMLTSRADLADREAIRQTYRGRSALAQSARSGAVLADE